LFNAQVTGFGQQNRFRSALAQTGISGVPKLVAIPATAPVHVTCDAETGHRKQGSQLAFRTAKALDDKQLLSQSDRMFIETRSFFRATNGDYDKIKRISVAASVNKTPQRLEKSSRCY